MTPWVSSASSLCSHFCTMQRYNYTSLNFHWLQLHNATVQDYTFCTLPLTHTKHKMNVLNVLTQLYVRIDMATTGDYSELRCPYTTETSASHMRPECKTWTESEERNYLQTIPCEEMPMMSQPLGKSRCKSSTGLWRLLFATGWSGNEGKASQYIYFFFSNRQCPVLSL